MIYLFDPLLRGGEGQLFESPLTDNKVLKRWFETRIKDIPESIRLLKEAKNVIESNPELSKCIEVVEVTEQGKDWIIRGFDLDSHPLKKVISDPIVSKIRNSAIETLSNEKGDILQNILKKLNKNSANLHWSPGNEKILIIDMQ